MKKTLAFILIIATLALLFAACKDKADNDFDEQSDKILFYIEGASKTQLTLAEFLALEQSAYNISRTNSKGVTTFAEYSGVKWDKLSKAIGAPEDTVTVILIASDGFTQSYGLDVLNAEKSIFAIYMDKALITQEADKGQVWFCADESFPANYWTKYIEKIVISTENT